MPHVEIDNLLPDELSFLQQLAAERGWKIGRIRPTAEEMRETLMLEWTRQVSEAKRMLDLCHNPEDPTIIPRQKRAALRLLNDIFTNSEVPSLAPLLNPRGDHWEHATNILLHVLACYLPKQPPEGTSLRYTPRGRALLENRKRQTIQLGPYHGFEFPMPEDVIFLLDSSGLPDGVAKSPYELGRRYDVSPSVADGKVHTALNSLAVNPLLRQTILENP